MRPDTGLVWEAQAHACCIVTPKPSNDADAAVKEDKDDGMRDSALATAVLEEAARTEEDSAEMDWPCARTPTEEEETEGVDETKEGSQASTASES